MVTRALIFGAAQSSRPSCMCHLLREMGAELKVSVLGQLNLPRYESASNFCTKTWIRILNGILSYLVIGIVQNGHNMLIELMKLTEKN